MIRSALYIDFDNFFGGLFAADPTAALEVVERPSVWLRQLCNTHTDGSERRWLVLRCYMNPSGWLPDPSAQGQRLYFSKFRPFFTQSGIEVVDCPSLTRGAKNGADIRIVIDVMAALRANTRYDEFVIASSDADFTPLLQVLRADDRRVTVVATGSTAIAYESLADRFLDEQDVFELCHPEAIDDGKSSTTGLTEEARPTPPGYAPPEAFPKQTKFARLVEEMYEAAEGAINLSQLSSHLIGELGDSATSSHWFGAGSFVRALHRLDLPQVQFSQHYLWDPSRHEPPAEASDDSTTSKLPASISRFREVTKLPSIPSEHWPVVYQSLASYAALHDFNLTESTKWSRDYAAEQGVEIPRQAFTYAVRSCRDGGTPLNGDPAPTADQIAQALLTSVLRQATVAELAQTKDEERSLADWLRVEWSDGQGNP